jgi:hypothetical protein
MILARKKPLLVEKAKIYLSSHKILWAYLSEHNAHFSGKEFIRLSVWAISQLSTFLCTGLSTEIGDREITQDSLRPKSVDKKPVG